MEKEQNTQKKGKKAPMSKKKLILLAVEILVLVAAVCILIIVMNFEDKNTRVNIDEEVLDIHVEVAENESMKGFRNIALFGVDSTTGSLGKDKQSKTRSDTIIIASINEETIEVKLVSVYQTQIFFTIKTYQNPPVSQSVHTCSHHFCFLHTYH